MYSFLLRSHSGIAYLLLFLLIVCMAIALRASILAHTLTYFYRLIYRIFLYVVLIQVFVGLALYFLTPLVQAAMADMASAMANSAIRLYAVEHPLMMLLGALVIHLGYIKATKLDSIRSHLWIFAGFLLGGVFFISRIPFANW